MLKANNITYQYLNNAILRFPEIECERGNHSLLLGHSGSGKTTLLHILAGLRLPKTGSVEIDGINMTSLRGASLDHFRGKNVGIVFQQSHFVRSLNVSENLLLAQHFAGLKKDVERVDLLLERLNISHKKNDRPYRLSQGEQQRVAIARAVINRPRIILADEPTSALDDSNTDKVIALLQDEAEAENAALLVVTHDTRLKDKFPHRIEL